MGRFRFHPPPLIEALQAGDVDIASGGDTGVLFAIAHGVRISILGATVEHKEGGSAILVRGDSPLKTVSDLKGHKIALPYFTAQHYQLAKALEQAGVPWNPKLILDLDTTDGLSALINGQVDAFVVWDPNTAVAQTEHGARILKNLKEVVDNHGALYAPTSDLSSPARAAALEDMARRIIRAQAWVNAHPDEWAQQVAKLSRISIGAARLQMERSALEYAPATDADIVRGWQQEIDYFHSIGEFQTSFDINKYIAKGFPAIVESEDAKIVAAR